MNLQIVGKSKNSIVHSSVIILLLMVLNLQNLVIQINSKNYSKKHFTSSAIEEDPIELEDIPEFIEKLQRTSIQIDTTSPTKEELLSVINKLKDGKSANNIPIEYIKHSLGSEEFVNEITKLYETIWTTKVIPKEWGHSKLVALWKGPAKGKADDPRTYRGTQIGSSLCKLW